MLLCDISSIRSGCELEKESVDGGSTAFMVVDKKEVESLTDISEDQEVINISKTKNGEKIIECMIVMEKYSEIQEKNFLMIKWMMLNR